MVSVRTQTAVIAVIFAAATCVLAGRHGGRGGFENELPRPTFLQGLNRTDVRAFYQIALNQNLTRNQINTELSSWASNQTTEIQSEFNTWTANVSSAISQIVEKSDAIAANLSSDAQTLYDEIKAVRSNNDLTGLQQCNETQTILRNASSTVARELFRAIPQVAGPPCRPAGGRHGGRHGGFGGRHGGFGGNQGGFGGFGGSQGGFGGSQGGFGGFGGSQGGFGGSQGGFGGNQGGFGGFGGSQGGFGGNQGGFGSNQNGFGSLGRFSGGQNDFPGNQGDFGAFGGNSRF